jgi:hypothetical protein
MGRRRRRDEPQRRQHRDRFISRRRQPHLGAGARICSRQVQSCRRFQPINRHGSSNSRRPARTRMIVMAKNRLALLFAVSIFCVPQSVVADENSYGIPAKWFACTTSDDCGKVDLGCDVVIMAVNTKYVRDAQHVICNSEPNRCIGMLGCQGGGRDHTVVLCANNQCTIKR